MEDIKKGDFVYLKTGSNKKFVLSIDGDSAVCTWEDKNKPYEATYKLIQLTKKSGDEPFSDITLG